MFRKSPYLDRFPVLSLQPEQISRYRLRRSRREDHFCTSEVGALCLELAGEIPALRRRLKPGWTFTPTITCRPSSQSAPHLDTPAHSSAAGTGANPPRLVRHIIQQLSAH